MSKSRRFGTPLYAAALVCVLLGTVCLGEDVRYVRQGAVGAGNGLNWRDAFTNLPPTLTRGYTYYVADGVYGGYTFDDKEVGEAYITLKKATQAAHGAEAGWDDAFGDGVAEFTNWKVESSYWDLDGTSGRWASDWPGYVSYGFMVHRMATQNSTRLIHIGTSGDRVHHIRIRHTEAYYDNLPEDQWFNGMHGIYAYIGYTPGEPFTNGLHVSWCWIRNIGSVNLYIAGPTTFGGVVEYTALESNGRAQLYEQWASAEHSQLVDWAGNSEFRYNLLRRWRSTGALTLLSSDSGGYSTTNFFIHGNIWTTDQDPKGGGALKGFNDASQYRSHVRIYNNTFVDIPSGGEIATGGLWLETELRNNLFYNVHATLGKAMQIIGPHARSHNWYFDVGTDMSEEIGVQIGKLDPFVNRMGFDYRLKGATQPGLEGLFASRDLLGILRGADLTWDRGAFEHNVGGKTSPPAATRAGVEELTSPTVAGEESAVVGKVIQVSVAGSVNSEGTGHPTEYQVSFGDGEESFWGNGPFEHTYRNQGSFQVTARARCADHTQCVSVDSAPPFVIVVE